VDLKSDLIKGMLLKKRMLSLEGDNLVVFCYLNASEIWPDNRGGLYMGVALLEGGLLYSFCNINI